MSEWLNCASTEPSTVSTIEWTMLCGCTITSTRAMGTSNNQRASIISSPLLNKVAESIVILRPISHVGCCSAWAGVAARMASGAQLRNGPPEAVRMRRRTWAEVTP